MTNIRNWVAFSATAALVAVSLYTFAQDDLDDLLKDLEGGSAKPAAATEEKPAATAGDSGSSGDSGAAAEAPAAEADAVRIVVTDAPKGITPALADFSVFGIPGEKCR